MAATITAVADTAAARVALTVRGVPAAEAVLVLRRDSDGVEVVRDTSEGTVLPVATIIGRNLVIDPNATNTARHNLTAATGSIVSGRLRVTSTATTGVAAAPHGAGASNRMPAAAGERIAARAGVYGHATKTLYAQVAVEAFDTGGSGLGTVTQSLWVTIAPLAVVAIEQYGVAPANTGTVRMVVRVAGDNLGGPLTAVGDWFELDNLRVDTGPTAPATGPYGGMSGATADGGTPTTDYAWTGTADASTSTATTQQVLVYDNEPRQGEGTDYLVTDTDGVVLAAAPRLNVPTWGTWLKSLGRPFLNTRCYFGGETPPRRTARRQLVAVEGATKQVALTEPRLAPSGTVTLVTLTTAQAQAVTEALASGETLMLDTAAAWRSPYRYISVGDVAEGRGVGDGELGLDREARVWTLTEVAEVEPPVGVTQTGDVTTYDELQPLYGTYAGLAATVPDYDAIPVT